MLGDMPTSGFSVWKTRAVGVLARGDSFTPHSSPAAYTSDVGAGKECDEDIVEVPVDEHFYDKEVFKLPLGLRKYEREKTKSTIS